MGNFHSYRNGSKREEEYEVEDDQSIDQNHEVEVASPPPIGNWADELSDGPTPDTSPKKNPLDTEVRDLREKLNSMKMAGNNRPNGENQNQRFQKPRHGDRQNGQGDRQNGHGDRQNGHGDRHNGHGDQKFNRNRPNRNQPPPPHQKACQSSLPLPRKNTVNFDPSHEPPQMRIIAAEPGLKKYNRRYQTRDVVMASDIFCQSDDLTIYNKLLDEIEHSGVDIQRLWQLWHGDSHVIADDHLGQWKEKCPTFSWVVEKMASYFDMDVKATRLNWYRDSSEWKPFHHDAAAMKEKFARTQNFTLGVSFGAEREAAFEHAQTKTIISMPQPNGAVYTFGRDVNIIWRHGIPQLPPEKQSEEGRISIIAWGWIDMDEV